MNANRSKPSLGQIGEILERAREAAVEYYHLTGKPLGITGEVGEYEAARLLQLDLTQARQAGYDATNSAGVRFQIKTRSFPSADARKGQRMGSIRLEHDWDAVLLVLLNERLLPTEIHQADREAIVEALRRPGSRSRNERGALAVSKFKSIGTLVWKAGG